MQDNCGQKHQSSLHREKSEIDSKNQSQKSNNVEVEQRILNSRDAEDSINLDSLAVTRNQLQYMPVSLINSKTSIQCYAMLSNCSSCSYICKATAEELNSVPNSIISATSITLILTITMSVFSLVSMLSGSLLKETSRGFLLEAHLQSKTCLDGPSLVL